MQEFQFSQELNDEDLEQVVGGSHHRSLIPSNGSTGTGISVGGFANGGMFNIDEVLARTESFTVTNNKGQSLSFAFGFVVAAAL